MFSTKIPCNSCLNRSAADMKGWQPSKRFTLMGVVHKVRWRDLVFSNCKREADVLFGETCSDSRGGGTFSKHIKSINILNMQPSFAVSHMMHRSSFDSFSNVQALRYKRTTRKPTRTNTLVFIQISSRISWNYDLTFLPARPLTLLNHVRLDRIVHNLKKLEWLNVHAANYNSPDSFNYSFDGNYMPYQNDLSPFATDIIAHLSDGMRLGVVACILCLTVF